MSNVITLEEITIVSSSAQLEKITIDSSSTQLEKITDVKHILDMFKTINTKQELILSYCQDDNNELLNTKNLWDQCIISETIISEMITNFFSKYSDDYNYYNIISLVLTIDYVFVNLIESRFRLINQTKNVDSMNIDVSDHDIYLLNTYITEEKSLNTIFESYKLLFYKNLFIHII